MPAERTRRYAVMLLLAMTAPAAMAQEDEPPSPAMLDYLGGWELDNGERIDPIELERMDVPKQESKAREKDDHKDH